MDTTQLHPDAVRKIEELTDTYLARKDHMESAIEYAQAAKELKYRAKVVFVGNIILALLLIAMLVWGGLA